MPKRKPRVGYREAALRALLGIIERATPENQPSAEVLETYRELLPELHEEPPGVKGLAERLEALERNVRALPGHPRQAPTMAEMRRMGEMRRRSG